MGELDRKTEIKVVHGDTKYTIDLKAELAVDPTNLEKAFLEQAGRFAWYAAVHAGAQKVVEMKKLHLDVVKSQRAADFRGEVDEKGKKKSETAIASMLDSDLEVRKAVEDLIDARHQENLLKAARESFVHRRDMLWQLGASERQERRDSAV